MDELNHSLSALGLAALVVKILLDEWREYLRRAERKEQWDEVAKNREKHDAEEKQLREIFQTVHDRDTRNLDALKRAHTLLIVSTMGANGQNRLKELLDEESNEPGGS